MVTSFRQNPGKGVALPCDKLTKDTISILVVKCKYDSRILGEAKGVSPEPLFFLNGELRTSKTCLTLSHLCDVITMALC